jgi:hypothetical protein
MDDRSEDGSKDKTSELKTALPFMSEFPFRDYEITMVERGEDFITLGVSPMLIKALGDDGTVNIINFYYVEEDSSVAISIYKEDIEWIADEAKYVKKMDALRKQLDEALSGEDLAEKAKAVKAGRKFTKSINCDNVTGIDFNELLSDFLKVNETVLHSRIKLGLQKLSVATLKSTEFSEKQFKAVSAFLNFQIHYAKILLGIVIAAKIY